MSHNKRYLYSTDQNQCRPVKQEVKVSQITNQKRSALDDIKLQPDRDVKEPDLNFSVSKEDAPTGKLSVVKDAACCSEDVIVPMEETMASFVGKEKPQILKDEASCSNNMTAKNLSKEQALPLYLASQKFEETNQEKVLPNLANEPGDGEETSSNMAKQNCLAQENSELDKESKQNLKESIKERSNLRVNLKGEEENDEFCQDFPSSRSVNSLKSTLEKGKESESEYSKDTIQQSSEIHKMSKKCGVAEETHVEDVHPKKHNNKLRDVKETSSNMIIQNSPDQENSELDRESNQKLKESIEEYGNLRVDLKAVEDNDEASSINDIPKNWNEFKCCSKDENQLSDVEKQKMNKIPVVGSDSISNSRHDEASVLAEEREKNVKLTEENRKLKETIREKDEKLERYEAKTKENHDEASVLAEEREKNVKLTEENRKLKETIREKDEKLERYEAKENHDEIKKEVIKTERNPSDGMYSPKKENTSTMEDLDEPCCSKDLGPQPSQQPTRILPCVAKGESKPKKSLRNFFCSACCTLQSFFFACSLLNFDFCPVKFVKKIEEKLQNTAITKDFHNCSFYPYKLLELGLLELSSVEQIINNRENLNEALKQEMSKLKNEGEYIALLRIGFKGSHVGHFLVIMHRTEESDPSVMMYIYDAQNEDWWPSSEHDINDIDKIQVFKIKKKEVKEFLPTCGKQTCCCEIPVVSIPQEEVGAVTKTFTDCEDRTNVV